MNYKPNNYDIPQAIIKNAGLFSIMGASFGAKVFAGNQDKKRVLRFGHLTDVHIEPEPNAPAWQNVFTTCNPKKISRHLL